MPDDRADAFDLEAVVPRGDGRVRREDAAGADGGDRVVGQPVLGGGVMDAQVMARLPVAALGGAGEVLTEQLDADEAGVALVHVEGAEVVPDGAEHASPADAENGLLADAVVRVARVEACGELAGLGVVLREVGVEVVDRHEVSAGAEDIEAPGADDDILPVDGDHDAGRHGAEGLFRGPGGRLLDLLAAGAETLAEVAAPVEQRDADIGQFEVRRRPGGCRRRGCPDRPNRSDVGVEADLEAEVGDVTVECGHVLVLVPVGAERYPIPARCVAIHRPAGARGFTPYRGRTGIRAFKN
jgi:hypothetical protein